MSFIINGSFMEGKEVGMEEVLSSREKRVHIQNRLIEKYNFPVISFTMNIPGPVKTNRLIKNVFDYGKRKLLKELEDHKIEILELKELNENTGNELFISAKIDARVLKKITVEIEEEKEVGRLFDMDVIDINREKLSRNRYRKCFICDKQAQECGRSRNHSLQELQIKVKEILEAFENKK